MRVATVYRREPYPDGLCTCTCSTSVSDVHVKLAVAENNRDIIPSVRYDIYDRKVAGEKRRSFQTNSLASLRSWLGAPGMRRLRVTRIPKYFLVCERNLHETLRPFIAPCELLSD